MSNLLTVARRWWREQVGKPFWTCLWRWEWIPLGRAAPHVLGMMLGSKGHRIDS